MAVTYEAFRQAEPPTRAVRAARTVDRWGLVAGVTGVLGNVLLAVLFTTPTDGPHAWTGPASDVIGVVSTLAIVPVVAGLLTVCGNRPGLGAITALAITALAAMAVAELAYVLGVVPFTAEVDGTFAGLIVVFGWLFAASRAGRTSGRLPRQVASCGIALGAAGLAGAVLLAASVPTPAHSLAHAIAFGAGGLISGPVYAVFPIWLIVLSYRLPGRAGSAGQLV
jgi:hypothetical protein